MAKTSKGTTVKTESGEDERTVDVDAILEHLATLVTVKGADAPVTVQDVINAVNAASS
jgi:hypothetical protein